MKEMQNIEVKGYVGKWSAFDKRSFNGTTYYLLEHNYYGDETCYLVVNSDMTFIEETYDDIKICLEDLEVI